MTNLSTPPPPLVLGIESSCDETGVALFDAGTGKIVAEALHSQIARHAPYGGVVPELASRDHIIYGLKLVDDVLRTTDFSGSLLKAVAYTQGPGLAGALLVGAQLAASLAYAWGKPLIGVHHMEGHLLSPLLADPAPTFPFVALLVSGGHTQLMRVDGVGRYDMLGDTIDDAAGEAFDKSAKLLGLAYPGGPLLAKLAEGGDPKAFAIPRPLLHSGDLNFSFAGLKTAVANEVRRLTGTQLPARGAVASAQPTLPEDHPRRADLAASVQAAIVDSLVTKSLNALKQTGLKSIVVAGGVGANAHLRSALTAGAATLGATVFYPPIALCTDNGAMIAHVGALRLREAKKDYSINVRPRWALSELRSPLEL
ncbi:MAG: tRNA (adenosine(37)-N6)-threonylcarbamoyltransferase complex transferase subunit TsaD [Betaproteobacteria bacterium]|nr:MAG: tRNA (adenosine(37)-N6)-threonylcarbamoyltransferase complex transferase subunit TsaD [Betaproteobacteria bacterium]